MQGFKEYKVDEAINWKRIKNALRGFDKEAIIAKVDKLDKSQLKSIVSHGNPKSAQRVMHPKDYTLWKAAYDRLQKMNESLELEEASIPEELAKELGPEFSSIAKSFDETDKGITIQFRRPLTREEIKKVAGRLDTLPGVKLGNRENTYHFNEQVDLDEALNTTQRRKRAISMRRHKNKMKVGRERAKRRTANKDVLMRRAKKAARQHYFKKLASGKSKGDTELAMRKSIEQRLDRMGGKVDQLAKRLYPKLKRKEMERKKS